MKLLLMMAALVFFVSCNKQPDCESNAQGEEAQTNASCPVPDPEGPTTPPQDPDTDPEDEVPHEALIFETSTSLNNFEVDDEIKVNKALEIIKKVIATKEFRNRVLNFTYLGKKQFLDNGGKSNAQIYQSLLDGSEELSPENDHEMDLELELYYSYRNVVGYTYPNVLRIWMNTKYFNVYTPAEVAGNVFHEWTHKLGYEHASSYSVARDSSVPYALGYIMEELGKKHE